MLTAGLFGLGFGVFWQKYEENGPEDIYDHLTRITTPFGISLSTFAENSNFGNNDPWKGKIRTIRSPNKGKTLDRQPNPSKNFHNDRFTRLKKGRALVRKHLYGKAISVLKPLFTNPPTEWATWFWMGTAYLGSGHYESARNHFREGLARDDTIAELWVQGALAEYQLGEYGRALRFLRQAELLAPTFPQVHLNLAFTFERQGDGREALRHYHEYLSLTKGNLSHLRTRQKVLERILNLEPS